MNNEEFLKEEINWDEINKWKINDKWHTEWEMDFNPNLQAFVVKSGYYFDQDDIDIYSEMNIATAEKFYELTKDHINYFQSSSSADTKKNIDNNFKHLFKHLRERGGSRIFEEYEVSDLLSGKVSRPENSGPEIFTPNPNKEEVLKKYEEYLRTGIGFNRCLVQTCVVLLDDEDRWTKNREVKYLLSGDEGFDQWVVENKIKNICSFHIKELIDGSLEPEMFWIKEVRGNKAKYFLCSTLTGLRQEFNFPDDKAFHNFLLDTSKDLPPENREEFKKSIHRQISLNNFKSNEKALEHIVTTGRLPKSKKELVMKVKDKETGEFLNTYEESIDMPTKYFIDDEGLEGKND